MNKKINGTPKRKRKTWRDINKKNVDRKVDVRSYYLECPSLAL